MSAGTLTVTPCDSSGTWLVTLEGDHDLSTRSRLEEQTRAIWPFCNVAVIDLSDVAFIDSGVIRWLLNVERELEAAGAFTLSIVEGPPGSVADRLFGLLRMRHVLACYPTRQEALTQAPPRVGLFAWPRLAKNLSQQDGTARTA
jgi:ABC-type transporter Mla MlaB component